MDYTATAYYGNEEQEHRHEFCLTPGEVTALLPEGETTATYAGSWPDGEHGNPYTYSGYDCKSEWRSWANSAGRTVDVTFNIEETLEELVPDKWHAYAIRLDYTTRKYYPCWSNGDPYAGEIESGFLYIPLEDYLDYGSYSTDSGTQSNPASLPDLGGLAHYPAWDGYHLTDLGKCDAIYFDKKTYYDIYKICRPRIVAIDDLSLNLDYRVKYFLPPDTIYEGLEELGKCSDCGPLEDLDGILTKNDIVTTNVYIDPEDCTPEQLEEYTLSVGFESDSEEYGQEANYYESMALSDCEGGICNFEAMGGEGVFRKGDKVRTIAMIEKEEDDGEKKVISEKSGLFWYPIASHILLAASVNKASTYNFKNDDIGFKDQFEYFIQKSDVNSELAHIGKPIISKFPARYKLESAPWYGFIMIWLANHITKQTGLGDLYIDSGFLEKEYDRLVMYFPNIEARKLCYGREDDLPEGACTGLSHGGKIGVPLIISDEDEHVSVLAHELGHSMGDLIDEYNLVVWKRSGKEPNPIGPEEGIFTKNPRFPLCCRSNFICVKYMDHVKGTEEYKWITEKEEEKIIGIYLDYVLDDKDPPISTEDADYSKCIQFGEKPCGKGSTIPGNCLNPDADYIGYCGTLDSCHGMLYRDSYGSDPEDRYLTIQTANSISIMGSMDPNPNKLVYPEDTKCPLKNC